MGRDEPAVEVYGVEVGGGEGVVGQDMVVADCGCVGGEECEEMVRGLDEWGVTRQW